MSETTRATSSQGPSPVENEETTLTTHPRAGMAPWKWKGAMAVFLLTSAISGYDVSNVANIQPQMYAAFGNIELLPWIGLSYSLANMAVLSYARKIIYCFNLKTTYLIHLAIFAAGAAVAGAASNITTVIVGRVIMGIGGSVIQQTNMTFIAVFATAEESTGAFGLISAMWATGLVIGGPIGSAFAENQSATWRWAFYFNLPLVGAAFIGALLSVQSHSLAPKTSILQRLLKIDPSGVALNAAAPVLLAIAITFSGPIWDWGSASSTALWVISILTTIVWGLQQYFCILTTREERAFPMHMLRRLDLIPLWLAAGCAGAAYAVTLYYTPLYFAFARGHDALEQTERILPFVIVFIFVVLLTGGVLLPRVGFYKIIFILAGIFTTAGAAAMAATISDLSTSEAQVMGLEALIGIGLGMHFQHSQGVSNVINKNTRDRVDSSVICNLTQMTGIAMILAVAGAIYQNVGFDLLQDAINQDGAFTEHEVREALAGVSSSVWRSDDAEARMRGVEAVVQVIADEFYIVIGSGAICLLCGVLMKWERLDYGKTPKAASSDEKGPATV
ncbi:major facilitator superfamily domain-containing protein [Emericellopsis atlantica]|uniref:Major facilitator superfamily domain-containing protein n=1 Tax=Emericellopsis atlantica TaxID=2614577 RepID=A0A9P8CM52_9HYPO|nr:major facilitator superfamily domain-containing protein [Emericellopsis atlantica]KAG9250306.1 major facilitator superfamily domain-containing protein [Emericellopsis atlantica]